jgi:hypothetical protein
VINPIFLTRRPAAGLSAWLVQQLPDSDLRRKLVSIGNRTAISDDREDGKAMGDAASRGERARQRSEELNERHRRLVDGLPVTARDAARAQLRAEEAHNRAEKAHEAAEDQHQRMSELHERVAKIHDPLAERGCRNNRFERISGGQGAEGHR